jgi:hypothetical protein
MYKPEYVTNPDTIPQVDGVIHFLKILGVSTVLKNEQEALRNETLESKRRSDIYLECVEGRVTISSFAVSEYELKAYNVPDNLIEKYKDDLKHLPEPFLSMITKSKSDAYVETYIEENNYYRMLMGLPKFTTDGVLVNLDFVPTEALQFIRTSVPIHLMETHEQNVLHTYGVIERMVETDPNGLRYLKHTGSNSVDVYTSRRAPQFGLLFISDDCPEQISARYTENIAKNREYIMNTVYSDAFKYRSDYYDNMISLLIVIMTITDVLSEIPDMIIKREFFDIKMVKIIFEANGIDFFPTIPYRYQIAMLKNLNNLIKYKSTGRNIIDICSLFGFDNIKVFKYYILKERIQNVDGTFRNATMMTKDEYGNDIEILDEQNNCELKFVKVPIDDIADNYILDPSSYTSYNQMTDPDRYWAGDLTKEIIMDAVLQEEFNYWRSKYISIDAIYSVTQLSFQLSYFYHIFFDDVFMEEALMLAVPTLNLYAHFRVSDLLAFLFALKYEYAMVEDKIITLPSDILFIQGFRQADALDSINTYIQNIGLTLDALKVYDTANQEYRIMGFNKKASLNKLDSDIRKMSQDTVTLDDLIPEYLNDQIPILTMAQFREIFINNKEIYDHVVYQMRTADNKDIYDLYKRIYDSLFISDLNTEFFRVGEDNHTAATYTEFLAHRDSILSNQLAIVRSVDDEDVRINQITILIDAVVYALEEYLDSDEFKYIFNIFPSVSAEAVRGYIFLVIDFFKSYKINIASINSVYLFDDRLGNRVSILEKVWLTHVLTKPDVIDILEKMRKKIRISYKEFLYLKEEVYRSITMWKEVLFNHEVVDIEEEIKKHVDLRHYEPVFYNDYMSMLNVIWWMGESMSPVYDSIPRTASMKYSDKYVQNDNLIMSMIHLLQVHDRTNDNSKDRLFEDEDKPNITSVYDLRERLDPTDRCTMTAFNY